VITPNMTIPLPTTGGLRARWETAITDLDQALRAANRADLAEEASEAYKDAREVVLTVQEAGIARMVAQLRPLGVVKG